MLYVFIVFVILFVGSVIYRFAHVRENAVIKSTMAENNMNLSCLGSVNGIGLMYRSSFATNSEDPNIRIYYIFFTFFFIPILPMACVVARKPERSVGFLGINSEYITYGITTMQLGEVLSSYAFLWAVIAFIIGMFYL